MRHVVCVVMLLLLPTLAHAVGIELLWDYVDGPTPAVSFSLYRDVGCTGGFLFAASVPRNTLRCVDLGAPGQPLVAGQRYCYQLTAIGAEGGESDPSNIAEFQVPLPPPRPQRPTNLRGSFVP